jgi:endonuclease III
VAGASIRTVPTRRVCAELSREYGSPRHGNKRNPLDELIYIILSTRTRDESYQETFRKLKRAYPSWSLVDGVQRRKLEAILKPGGLGRLKARQIIGIVRSLSHTFGHATLAPLQQLSDADAEAFLK